MSYRVLMELLPRPNDTPEWAWNETNANSIYSNGGKAWTGKLTSDGTIWEYDSESDANAKMTQLDNADSTNRRYKVVEI
tara:strand:- start:1739 stop:1975 length:237 start_codon:yes stop_codon:yes gene_type:complete